MLFRSRQLEAERELEERRLKEEWLENLEKLKKESLEQEIKAKQDFSNKKWSLRHGHRISSVPLHTLRKFCRSLNKLQIDELIGHKRLLVTTESYDPDVVNFIKEKFKDPLFKERSSRVGFFLEINSFKCCSFSSCSGVIFIIEVRRFSIRNKSVAKSFFHNSTSISLRLI